MNTNSTSYLTMKRLHDEAIASAQKWHVPSEFKEDFKRAKVREILTSAAAKIREYQQIAIDQLDRDLEKARLSLKLPAPTNENAAALVYQKAILENLWQTMKPHEVLQDYRDRVAMGDSVSVRVYLDFSDVLRTHSDESMIDSGWSVLGIDRAGINAGITALEDERKGVKYGGGALANNLQNGDYSEATGVTTGEDAAKAQTRAMARL